MRIGSVLLPPSTIFLLTSKYRRTPRSPPNGQVVTMKVDTRHLQCRFYESQFPEVESLVMVNVRHIAEMGAYVSLLEYDNVEGMILLSELSRRRIRSINKLIRVNRNEVVMVLRVDKEKGYIDLSKRRVSPEDIAKCEDRYNKAKAVHSVLRHLADQRKLNLSDLYEQIGWPLYKKYGHAYDAFKLTLQPGDDTEDPFVGMELEADLKDDLLAYIKKRLAPQPIKVRGGRQGGAGGGERAVRRSPHRTCPRGGRPGTFCF